MASQFSLADTRTHSHTDADETLIEEPQSFTVGKIDAGVAVLLGPAFHLVEFPSVLLPASCRAGSIVSISCQRALDLERDADLSFQSLQESILKTYGTNSPTPPELSILGTTQTSTTLSWAPLQIANAKLLSLSVYRNNERLSLVPNPFQNTATKVSSLTLNTEYEFYLILKTTAGIYHSNHVKVKTHTINDTSGVNVCFGHIYPNELRDEAEAALRRMNAKWSAQDTIDIETTHFVCTSVGSGNFSQQMQKAERINLPIITPNWILACDREKKMTNVSNFLLSSEPSSNNPQALHQASQAASHAPVAQQAAPQPPASQQATPQANIYPQPQSTNQQTLDNHQAESTTTTASSTPINDRDQSLPASESGTEQKASNDSSDSVKQASPSTPSAHEENSKHTKDEEDESASPKEPSEVDKAEEDVDLQTSDIGSLEDVKI